MSGAAAAETVWGGWVAGLAGRAGRRIILNIRPWGLSSLPLDAPCPGCGPG